MKSLKQLTQKTETLMAKLDEVEKSKPTRKSKAKAKPKVTKMSAPISATSTFLTFKREAKEIELKKDKKVMLILLLKRVVS